MSENLINRRNIAGIDHGNSMVKMVRCTESFSSGIEKNKTIPPFVDEYIVYKDFVYTISSNPNYLQDKTADENMFIQTLFALVKESKAGGIDLKRPITLSIGLPPLHMTRLKEKYIQYFLEFMGDGVSFNYCGKDYVISIDKEIFVFPQDYAAVKAFSPRTSKSGKIQIKDEFIKDICKGTFLAIDIGGFTVDVIYFENGKPVFNGWTSSRELGTNRMSETIINRITMQTGFTLERSMVESVIREEKSSLPKEVIDLIKNLASEWANNILKDIRTVGVDLRVMPVLFIGSGSKLLQSYLEKSDYLENYHFLKSSDAAQANAIGYYFLAQDILDYRSNR